MKRLILLFMLTATHAFGAQTECYFDNKFEDGTYGFLLKDESVTLMLPYQRYKSLERSGNNLILDEEIMGSLKLFLPRGIIKLGEELSSFKCTVWIPRDRG